MFYHSGGEQLFYTEQGSGFPVLLLHPTPVDSRFWLPIASMLSARFRVILPDLRGHGQSEAGPGAISMEKLGSDLIRLLDTLQVPRALLAGCSIGGYALFEIWRRVPDRVAALAFCCSKPQADTEQNSMKRRETITLIRERGTEQFVESMVGSLIGPTARARWPQKVEEARHMMSKMRPEAVIAVQEGLASRPNSVPTAKTIRVPSFILAGGEDQGSTPADMRLLAETIRNGGYGAEYHELPDAGHYAPWEQPQVVGPLLRRFFESVTGF